MTHLASSPATSAAHCMGARAGGVHPLLARLFAARGVRADELDDALALLPPAGLLGDAAPSCSPMRSARAAASARRRRLRLRRR
jgi:hypothetical protein